MENVADRPVSSHEYLFLLSKQARYYYDPSATRQPEGHEQPNLRTDGDVVGQPASNHRRSVWRSTSTLWRESTPPSCPLAWCGGASMPARLSRTRYSIPFAGSGTVGLAAAGLHRQSVLMEQNPSYLPIIQQRLGVHRW
jgi:hypothetical protein